jgi:kynureninase
MTSNFTPTLSYANQLEQSDPLRIYRDRFVISDSDLIYMDGNSLGRLTAAVVPQIEQTVRDQWGNGLIRSWNAHWYRSPQRIGEKIALLAGAAPGQIVVTDSTSVNLYKLVMSALKFQQGRTGIVTDNMNFPSDLYILQGCIDTLGNQHQLSVIPSGDAIYADLERMYAAIDDRTALVTLSHVVFKSGYLYEANEVTRHAHQVGALVLWDLSHSIGAVPVELDRWNVDLAVGCTYKYLNGGPGAPAFLYVKKDLQEKLLSPIWGWFGQQQPFAFDLEYTPAAGIDRFLCGTPPIVSLQALEPGLDLILQVGIGAIREKSEQLTGYLLELFDALLAPRGFSLGSPRRPELRGSHISIRHPEGYRINRVLIDKMNVLPDFRTPDNIRLGLSPLYTSFCDVFIAVERICNIMDERLYEHASQEREDVT